MKHLIRAFIALGTAMCLAASAAPLCTSAAPADFQGSLMASAPGGQSVAATWFQQNGCDWAGNDLNGTDHTIGADTALNTIVEAIDPVEVTFADRGGFDLIAQGMSGLMSITGLPGQGPVRVGIPIADLCSGIFLAQGVLVALYERQKTGKGKWVHTSLLEAMLSMLDFQASRWLMAGGIPPQAGNNHPTGIPTGVFETADGHINIAAAGDEIYVRMCKAIGRPDLITDERFATSRARSKNRDEIMDVLMPVTRMRSSAQWIQVLNDAGVPCGPIYRIDQTFADPQVEHLGMAAPVRSPALGDITILAHPVTAGGQRPPLRNAAPELGQDNEEILTSLGYTKEQIGDLAKRGVI